MKNERPRDPARRFNTFGVVFIIVGLGIIANICHNIGNWMEETVKQTFVDKCSYVCGVSETQCISRCLKIFYKR